MSYDSNTTGFNVKQNNICYDYGEKKNISISNTCNMIVDFKKKRQICLGKGEREVLTLFVVTNLFTEREREATIR